ncbi:hypothetical protein FA10DRAFT_267986 [Acaromyces ingoldii]|uniref:Uncharacterized protein n=1 Tax=Acaromyces ingoldii TaxID=215250 RepID=A0A316YJ18_9BASI|nr:hypothetical protein FA10DRAFT_267986 [Acaromyces ingoldii]PWN89417.1 hypothetical protein FA10DRAFT_267986 [Acaromyces ingoldii]
MSELFDSLNFPSQRSFGASPSQRATFGVASGSQSSSQTSEPGQNALKRTPFRGEGAVGSASTAPTSGTTPAKVWSAGAGAGGSSSVQRRPAGHVYWHASPSPSMAAAATCDDAGSHAQVSPLGTQAFKEELLRGQRRQDPTFRKSTSAEKRAKRRARGENEDESQHGDHDQRTRKAARQSKRGGGSSLGNQRKQGLGLELESFLANLEGRLQLDDDDGNDDDSSQDTWSAEGAINSSMQRQPDQLMSKARSLSQDMPLLSHRRVTHDKSVETDGASFGPPHQDDVTGNRISNGAARGSWTKTASSPCLGRLSACHQQHGCLTAARSLGQPLLHASKIGVEVEPRDVFANDMKQMDAINENHDGKGAIPVEDRPPLQPVNTQRNSASPAKGVAQKQNAQRVLASEFKQQEQKPLQGVRRSARTPVKAASTSALQIRPTAPCLDEEAKSLRSSAAPSQLLRHGSAATTSISSGRSLGVGLSRAKSGPMMTTRSRVGLSRSSSSHQRATHMHGPSPDAVAAVEDRLSSSPTKARSGPGAPFKRPSRVPSTASMKRKSCKSEVVVISDDSDEDTAGWQSPTSKGHIGAAPARSTAVDTFEEDGTTGKGHHHDLGPVQANHVDTQKGSKEALSNAQDGAVAADEVIRHVSKTRACFGEMSKGLEGIERGEKGSNTASRASRSPDKALRSSIANPKPRIIGGGPSNATTPLRKRRGPAAVSGEDAAQAETTTTDSRNKETGGREASRQQQQQQQPGSDDSFEMEHLTELDEMLTAIGC